MSSNNGTCCGAFLQLLFHNPKPFKVLDKKELQTLEQSTQVSDIGESFPSNEEMREMKNCLEKEIGNHDITKEECKILIKQAEKFKDTNRELSKKLEIKEDDIMKMQIELNNKDQIIKRQRSQFDETLKNLNAANKTKTNLTNRIAEQDKKIARLELNVGSSSSPSPGKQQTREEIRIVRDALHSLRGSFNSNNSQQHTIDTIEQSIATLMERLHSAEMQLHTTHQNLIPEDEETQSLNYDSTGDPNRSPITSLHNFRKKSEENVEDIDGWTKCVYFTERAVTPYLFHIPKRIGEIRLKDFKEYFDRPGPYRYHFKALDPEFGMVKEEVVNDSDVLPGLDGKVIAWVEEDV